MSMGKKGKHRHTHDTRTYVGGMSGTVYDALTDSSNKNDIPFDVLATIARIESGFNPSAFNDDSGATGLYQFIRATAAQYGLGDRKDAHKSADAAGRLMRDNMNTLQAAGFEPSGELLYLLHQQGEAGGMALLQHPDKKVLDVLKPFYKSEADAKHAIVWNGGNLKMTAAQFVGVWADNYKEHYNAIFGKDPEGGFNYAGNGSGSFAYGLAHSDTVKPFRDSEGYKVPLAEKIVYAEMTDDERAKHKARVGELEQENGKKPERLGAEENRWLAETLRHHGALPSKGRVSSKTVRYAMNKLADDLGLDGMTKDGRLPAETRAALEIYNDRIDHYSNMHVQQYAKGTQEDGLNLRYLSNHRSARLQAEDEIVALKEHLAEAGYLKHQMKKEKTASKHWEWQEQPFDGKVDRKLMDAVADYQLSNGLVITAYKGVVDRFTLEHLENRSKPQDALVQNDPEAGKDKDPSHKFNTVAPGNKEATVAGSPAAKFNQQTQPTAEDLEREELISMTRILGYDPEDSAPQQTTQQPPPKQRPAQKHNPHMRRS